MLASMNSVLQEFHEITNQKWHSCELSPWKVERSRLCIYIYLYIMRYMHAVLLTQITQINRAYDIDEIKSTAFCGYNKPAMPTHVPHTMPQTQG